MGLVLIFPCIPGAFVTLPQEALEDDVDSFRNNQIESSSRQKFQIVSAGVWHNAITALLMALILYGGIGSMSHSLFWRNASNLVVESVEGVSGHGGENQYIVLMTFCPTPVLTTCRAHAAWNSCHPHQRSRPQCKHAC